MAQPTTFGGRNSCGRLTAPATWSALATALLTMTMVLGLVLPGGLCRAAESALPATATPAATDSAQAPADSSAAPPAAGSVPASAESAASAAPAATAAGDKSAAVGYAMAPLVGEIGKDLVPEGLEKLLAKVAANKDVRHVVFRIKCQGGDVRVADKFLGIMQKYGDKLQYHALVESAVGPAIWIVFGCDTVHVRDGATIGGPVMVRGEGEGQAEVEAGTDKQLGSRLMAGVTERNRSLEMVRAMILTSAAAYGWLDADGKPVIADQAPPADLPPERRVFNDDTQTVLLLTAEQAVKIGLAKRTADADQIGVDLALPGWKQAMKDTESIMLQAKQELDRAKGMAEKKRLELEARKAELTKKRQQAVDFVNRNQDEAIKNDPQRFSYTVIIDEGESVGNFAAESRQRWMKQTDLAVGFWQRVQSGVQALMKLEKECQVAGMEKLEHGLDLIDTHNRATREIVRLKSARNKLRP